MITALRRARVWIVALPASFLLLVVAPPQASAQVVATSFEELRALVKAGDTIYVTDPSGRKTKGRLGELSASSLELLVRKTGPDGRETFVPQARLSERDVRQILLERHDSVWNGTLIGLAVRAGPWLLAGAAARGGGSCGSDSNVCPFVALILGPIGAGIGALIDASMHERTSVYVHEPGQRSSGLHVSPRFSKSAAGIQMSVRF